MAHSGHRNLQSSVYEQNRARFTADDLQSHNGKLVAFSRDGSQIIASADSFDVLDELIVAAGADPAEVGIERIVLNEGWQGAIEFE